MIATGALAFVHERARRDDEALAHYREALATGHRVVTGIALNNLGDVHRVAGRCDEAADLLRQSLDIARGLGARPEEQRARARLDRDEGR